MNIIPSQPENPGKSSRGIVCAGDAFLTETVVRPTAHTLRTMRRDPRQSLPDLGSSCDPDGSRRHVRSHSVAGACPKSPDFNRHWLPNGNCPTYRAKEGDSRKARRRNNMPGLSDPKASTIHQHYYPEGGWGWIVLFCALIMDVLASTLPLSSGFFVIEIRNQFGNQTGYIEPGKDHMSKKYFSLNMFHLIKSSSVCCRH